MMDRQLGTRYHSTIILPFSITNRHTVGPSSNVDKIINVIGGKHQTLSTCRTEEMVRRQSSTGLAKYCPLDRPPKLSSTGKSHQISQTSMFLCMRPLISRAAAALHSKLPMSLPKHVPRALARLTQNSLST